MRGRLAAWWEGLGEPPSHALTRCLYSRALAAIYLVAFASLGAQIEGLAGSRGILPAAELLDAARRSMGAGAFLAFPTLFWLDVSDAALRGACYAGAAAAFAAMAGAAVGPCLLLCWALYLSLAAATRVFLGFQWDALLLEAGFLAIFLAPWRPRCRLPCPSRAPVLPLLLTRWLLFRLMLSSGVVKLTSGDPAWRDLTALLFHYETQPIPTWTAWYAHHLPRWVHAASVAVMYVLEIGFPFLILGTARMRAVAAAGFTALSAVFMATGNFAFFNWLTIVLCIPLLPDAAWPRRRAGPAGEPEPPSHRRYALATRPPWRRAAGAAAALPAAVLVLVTAMEMTDRLGWRLPWPGPVVDAAGLLGPLRVANAYGLFAVMTKSRPEIAVEGSDDGVTWREYAFKWKPGDLERAPAFVAPHQPRLDWQMWFAALGDARRNPWFTAFLRRLLEGSPPVLALLDGNPFPERPPRLIRARLLDYHFTTPEERRRTGAWWTGTEKGLYHPAVSLPPPGAARRPV